MNSDEFWKMIDKARAAASTIGEVPELLVEWLSQRSISEIIAFSGHFEHFRDRAYDMRLWAAATVICRHCSDDVFDYFTGWLIAQGRTVYEQALEDPDSLANLPNLEGKGALSRLESMLSVSYRAYEKKTSKSDFWDLVPPSGVPRLKNSYIWNGTSRHLKQLVPRLLERFPP